MGRENTIKTGVNNTMINNGISLSSYNLTGQLPKSIYSFAVVTYVNPSTKEVTYNIIEDNLGLNKTGIAKPLYPNKIILPQTGSIVPLIKGPDMGISTNVGQYDKTVYYMDPIGIQQTVDNNIIVKEVQTTPNEINVNTNNIRSANIGIANNNPKGDIIPCPDGLYGVFWNRMPFGFQYGKYVKGLKVPNHETHIHISFRTPQKAVETINLALSYGLFARENAYIESVDGAHSSAST